MFERGKNLKIVHSEKFLAGSTHVDGLGKRKIVGDRHGGYELFERHRRPEALENAKRELASSTARTLIFPVLGAKTSLSQ